MMLARIFLLTCIHANIHTAAYCMHNMHSCILFCTTTLVKTHVEFFCACAQMYQRVCRISLCIFTTSQSIHTRVQYEYYSLVCIRCSKAQYYSMHTVCKIWTQRVRAIASTSTLVLLARMHTSQSSIQTARTRSYQICIVLASSMHTTLASSSFNIFVWPSTHTYFIY